VRLVEITKPSYQREEKNDDEIFQFLDEGDGKAIVVRNNKSGQETAWLVEN